jgi:hypothetical protein
MGRPARWIAYGLQLLLALFFAFSATTKLTGGMDDVRDLLGVVPWFWTLAGICQAVGAVALVAGFRAPRLAVAGALWLTAVMVGAVITHMLAGDSLSDMAAVIGLLVLLLSVAGMRWQDARIAELVTARTRRPTTSRPATQQPATR